DGHRPSDHRDLLPPGSSRGWRHASESRESTSCLLVPRFRVVPSPRHLPPREARKGKMSWRAAATAPPWTAEIGSRRPQWTTFSRSIAGTYEGDAANSYEQRASAPNRSVGPPASRSSRVRASRLMRRNVNGG